MYMYNWFTVLYSGNQQNIVNQLCCSVAKSYLTCCDPMDCSTPGFAVPHSLPEFAQVHIH